MSSILNYDRTIVGLGFKIFINLEEIEGRVEGCIKIVYVDGNMISFSEV